MRSDRQRRDNAARKALGKVDPDELGEATREVLREELRPAVREAITENVLKGVENLIGHIPKAVEVAAALMESTDEKTRYDAAKLILQHTTGNKAVIPDVNAGSGQRLDIVFTIPRPEDYQEGALEGEVIDAKECDSCHQTKPLAEFVAGSDRCTTCYAKMQNLVKSLEDGTAQSTLPTESEAAAVSP